MKITKGFYFLLAFFAIAIGLYPLKYLPITPARIKPGSNLLRGPVKIQHTS